MRVSKSVVNLSLKKNLFSKIFSNKFFRYELHAPFYLILLPNTPYVKKITSHGFEWFQGVQKSIEKMKIKLIFSQGLYFEEKGKKGWEESISFSYGSSRDEDPKIFPRIRIRLC